MVEGVHPDLEKTEKVKSIPVPPRDVTQVRQFLGASYYRCFVPQFAKIAAQLHASILFKMFQCL